MRSVHPVLKELTELFSIVIASLIWMATREPISLFFLAVFALLLSGSAWWGMEALGSRLPPPRTICDSLVSVLCVFAFLLTLIGAGSSYALGNANEAIEEAFTQFRRECFDQVSGAWRGTAFRVAAERVAALGPEYAASCDEALHGGLTLPLKDSKAALVVAEVYTEQAQVYLRSDDRPGYALLRHWLPMDKKPNLSDVVLPAGGTVLTANPDPKSFVGQAIIAGLSVAQTAVIWEISEYVETQQWKLCAPALCLWSLVFVVIISTAIRRIHIQTLRLDYRH